jgi:hypothetical protein
MQLEKAYLDLKINCKKPDWYNTQSEPLITFIYLQNNKT